MSNAKDYVYITALLTESEINGILTILTERLVNINSAKDYIFV